MAETPNFKFRYPIEADSPDIPRDMENLAKDIDKLLLERLFTKATHTANFTAVSGEMAQFITNAGVIATLPAIATANQIIGFINASPGECKIQVAGGPKIIGDFITGQTEIKLTVGQHVILFCDGTNWYIIAGEPKREQTYTTKAFTKAEMEAGVELSASRPVSAMLYKITGALSIGGQTVGGGGVTNMAYYIPPGQKIKDTEAVTAVFVVL